jgi:saccharopine dehydrogenase-like NADP-dependent oxidoreductase
VKHVVVFGAGRSSLYLIEYLAGYCQSADLQLTVCDREIGYAMQHIKNPHEVEFVELDIFDTGKVSALVQESVLIVSLLPAALHIHIARLCLSYKKNLATASYISDEMKALDQEVKSNHLVFLNEIGLDPGLDHLSAMQMMDVIRAEGGEITGFESYCGGLVADENDGDNPWKYKFSWNPRNVVVAGQGGPAQYLEGGKLKLVPYHQLFRHVEIFGIEGYGILEGYPNRDSLKYTQLYGLEHVRQMIRGTLRKQGYCRAWQIFVDLGLTDDTTVLEFPGDASLNEWINTYLPASELDTRENLQQYTKAPESEMGKLSWLGLFGDHKLPLSKGTSAQILEEVLKQKWKLQDEDKDLVVMLHRITYKKAGKQFIHQATMVLKGESSTHTAMAKTVGLPLAIACKLLLENKVQSKGVIAPVMKEIYEPVLEELAKFGILFSETTLSTSPSPPSKGE